MEGCSSDDIFSSNSVFQDAVLDPTLWNIFFADVGEPADSRLGRRFERAPNLGLLRSNDLRSIDLDLRSAAVRSDDPKVGRP